MTETVQLQACQRHDADPWVLTASERAKLDAKLPHDPPELAGYWVHDRGEPTFVVVRNGYLLPALQEHGVTEVAAKVWDEIATEEVLAELVNGPVKAQADQARFTRAIDRLAQTVSPANENVARAVSKRTGKNPETIQRYLDIAQLEQRLGEDVHRVVGPELIQDVREIGLEQIHSPDDLDAAFRKRNARKTAQKIVSAIQNTLAIQDQEQLQSVRDEFHRQAYKAGLPEDVVTQADQILLYNAPDDKTAQHAIAAKPTEGTTITSTKADHDCGVAPVSSPESANFAPDAGFLSPETGPAPRRGDPEDNHATVIGVDHAHAEGRRVESAGKQELDAPPDPCRLDNGDYRVDRTRVLGQELVHPNWPRVFQQIFQEILTQRGLDPDTKGAVDQFMKDVNATAEKIGACHPGEKFLNYSRANDLRLGQRRDQRRRGKPRARDAAVWLAALGDLTPLQLVSDHAGDVDKVNNALRQLGVEPADSGQATDRPILARTSA